MVLSGPRSVSVVFCCSNWFSKVLSVVVGSQWFSVVLNCSRRFSMILCGSSRKFS